MKESKKTKFFIAASKIGIRAIGLGQARDHGGFAFPEAKPGSAERRWQSTARRELDAYFSGRLRSFSARCDLGGLSPFTRSVLRATARIPYGELRSYRWVAERLGRPRAVRAVGNALARNPIPIFIPCHRVVRSDGSLGGYALGLDWKRKLLALERSLPRSRRPE